MALACLIAVIFWKPLTRCIMLLLFPIAFIVGGLGFYFHNEARGLSSVPQHSLSAWTDPEMKRVKGPPETAPLAFAGLGLLGLLASLKRFN